MNEPIRHVCNDRERAGSFGAAARLYDETRPSSPANLVAWLSEAGARNAVDVGCGTGQVSRLLVDAGRQVTGVEADERMASVARSHGIDVQVARFEEWRSDRKFDLVCSGQACHWVDPDVGYRRAAELISDGGQIAVFWNSFDRWLAEVRTRSPMAMLDERTRDDLLTDLKSESTDGSPKSA